MCFADDYIKPDEMPFIMSLTNAQALEFIMLSADERKQRILWGDNYGEIFAESDNQTEPESDAGADAAEQMPESDAEKAKFAQALDALHNGTFFKFLWHFGDDTKQPEQF